MKEKNPGVPTHKVTKPAQVVKEGQENSAANKVKKPAAGNTTVVPNKGPFDPLGGMGGKKLSDLKKQK